MAEWKKEVFNDGAVFHVNEDLGNVLELKNEQGETVFVSMIPRVLKFGPFKSLEDAKQCFETYGAALDNLLDQFNYEMYGKKQ